MNQQHNQNQKASAPETRTMSNLDIEAMRDVQELSATAPETRTGRKCKDREHCICPKRAPHVGHTGDCDRHNATLQPAISNQDLEAMRDVQELSATAPSAECEDNPTSRKIREAYKLGRFEGKAEVQAGRDAARSHAVKLAEALREAIATLDSLTPKGHKHRGLSYPVMHSGRVALAAWEAAQ